MKKVFGLFLLAVLCASAFVPARVLGDKPARNDGATNKASAEPTYVPGEVIVQFKSGASDMDKADARKLARASRKERLKSKDVDGEMGDNDLELDAVAQGASVDDTVRSLKNHPAVEFAEPNWVLSKQVSPNDPFYMSGYMWGMSSSVTAPSNSYGSQAARAWDGGYTGSRSVIVAVIDEGVDFNHRELSANMWVNPYEVVNGKDDDGNGFVDDVRGWDFAGGNNSVYDGKVGDNVTDDHGTHVAGTIGAGGGDGVGLVGVNWQVTIMPVKFLGAKGGTTANSIKAIDYVTNMKKRHPELNIVATNNSWGGGGYSQALHDAIIRAAKQNILFVVAAGNAGQNLDKRNLFPASIDTSVGTSTESAASYNACDCSCFHRLGWRSGFRL